MPPRRGGALAVAALVVALHLALLRGLAPGAGPGWQAEPIHAVQAVQVRQIAHTPAVAVAEPATPPRPTERPPSIRSSPQQPTAKSSPRTDDSPQAVATAPPPSDLASETPAETGGQAVPVYATRLPPASTLHFEFRRGAASGEAQLDWQPAGDHYRLNLKSQTAGAPGLGWTSQGGFDAAGLAPVRYTESRRGREVRAANFQRDSGRVTFSGPRTEHTLVPGGQDRLSWMVQLAAVLSANPGLAAADAQVSIWVVGTRGDAEVWTFAVQGIGALDLPAGRVEGAVHLTREPRRTYDTQVQVWLDPSRHHLPVQAMLRVHATGEGSEFRLMSWQSP